MAEACVRDPEAEANAVTMDPLDKACRHSEESLSTATSSTSRPKSLSHTSPSTLVAQSILDELAFESFRPLLPAPVLPLPRTAAGRGHRHRQRQQHKREVIEEVNHLLRSLNSLDSGMSTERTLRRTAAAASRQAAAFVASSPASTATRRLYQLVQKLAASAVQARRAAGLQRSSGAHATSQVIKEDRLSRYTFTSSSHKQIALKANLMDEPDEETPTVPLLEVLPHRESMFYASEENVVRNDFYSDSIFKQLEDRYVFVGGALEEYVKYLHATPFLWDFTTPDHVKAFCGISAVGKKSGRQRKLLMMVPANYAWVDAKGRSNLGMYGGSALANCYVPSGNWNLAIFDQSNAFTSLVTPSWFLRWSATPPVKAWEIWTLLPSCLQEAVQPMDWIAPCYKRLAMGSGHSVHLLMQANLEIIGRSLWQSRRLPSSPVHGQLSQVKLEIFRKEAERAGPAADDVPKLLAVSDDDEWLAAHQAKRAACAEPADGWSLDGWCDAVRAASRGVTRTFVVMHLFAGARRTGDLEDCLRQAASTAGLILVMLSVDIADDPRWDLAVPETFVRLRELVSEALVDAVLGGPPCSTWSKLRFRTGGPRPVRCRWASWGRADASPTEKARLGEANVLMLNSLGLMEPCVLHGGLALLEHPEDPGEDPYPSIWNTEEWRGFASRCGCTKCSIDQCPFGCVARKPTGLGTNIDGFVQDQPRCSGKHKRCFEGLGRKDDQGAYRSRRLATYSPEMCKWMADKIAKVFGTWLASGAGPTGWLRWEAKSRLITNWSSLPSVDRDHAVTFLNESAARAQRAVIDSDASAFYLHVDDGIVISEDRARANSLMDFSADALEEKGFVVTDRQHCDQLLKAVGYEVLNKPALLRYPVLKGAMLQKAMRWVASMERPQLSVVRSLLGIWLFGALLRRELLSAAFRIFHFVESDLERRSWWRSARHEFLVMSHLVAFMHIDVGTRASGIVLASDAQGAGELSQSDCGGFGVVAAEAPDHVVRAAWRTGFAPGHSIARLDGMLGSRWKPERTSAPTIPFSRLPPELFDLDWRPLARGRWKWADHITLGESRAHCRIARALAADGNAHHLRFIALQDNAATSASMSKGRSPAPALNYYCRQRAASLLGAEILLAVPWVQTSLQPADEESRRRSEAFGSATGDQDFGLFDAEVPSHPTSLPRLPHRQSVQPSVCA